MLQSPQIKKLDKVLNERLNSNNITTFVKNTKEYASFIGRLLTSPMFLILLIICWPYLKHLLKDLEHSSNSDSHSSSPSRPKRRNKDKPNELLVEVIKKQEPTKFSDVRGIDEFKD
jgi:hypothetical protein